ncbi:hypothetical protein WR25_02992 [Diploscapter pachys]|uniref:P-type domain-containing protein n=1 Tax=Diploscapter pachys TaxID=2018661 RepID=A0A2A2L1S3_9BILA|nr:hypothetical protein WR25_02992 [Diploscapter pachys]
MLVPILTLLLVTSVFSSVDVRSRIDCYPDPDPSSNACSARGCIWEHAPEGSPTKTPYCYYPRERGYVLKSTAGQTYTLTPDSSTKNPFGTNIDNLPVTVKNNGKTLLVTIGGDDRYVPPVGLPMNPSTSSDSLTFKVTTVPSTNIFAFQVTRQSTGTNVWDTTIGGLLFAEKYIQIATYLPSANVFGFGDHVHKQLMRNLTRYTTWPMFAKGIAPDSESDLSTQNLYGVHPFYIAMEADGNSHGVFFLNSNAQEVTLGPAPHLVYRTIGGRLDMAFFPGPLPEQVVQQYLAHIGTPFLPAYWALGYQLSRWGYNSLDNMKAVISRVQAAGVPLDVPYADIDYMNAYKDFTEGDKWTGFPNYTDQLHQQGLHMIVIFDPAVEVDYDSFKRALQQNATFIEWPSADLVPHNIQDQYPMAKNTLVMLGNVWPERNTAFPDFLDPTNQTTQWWTNEFVLFHQTLKFDGIWIDMNEPSNFETGTYSSVGSNLATAHLSCPISGAAGQLDNPPYATRAVYDHSGEHLCSRTLCMLGKSARRTMNFFDTKSLYGWSESRATNAALRQMTGRRGAVISRSTFPSSGRYAGHWLGDNTARWEDLQTSVINVMDFNFFGIPYVGSDICGFHGNSSEELCLRWHQMGAFHSFSRDHNTKGTPAQDPAVWPSVAAAAKMVLTFRYYYLPYLYSLHYASSRYGGTVVRPVFFEFPKDSTTQKLDYQFMWGSGMMIAPVVDKGVSSVHVYFPKATWYSLIPINYGVVLTPGYLDVHAATDSLTPVFLRGGYILPRQGANTTTTASRKNDLEVIIGVDPSGGSNGELYYDAGDDLVDDIESHKRHHWLFSFTYTSTSAVFSGLCEKCSDVDIPPLSIIEALGYPATPDFNSFILNGNKVNINVQLSSYSAITKRLFINTPKLIGLRTIASPFTLKWNHSS